MTENVHYFTHVEKGVSRKVTIHALPDPCVGTCTKLVTNSLQKLS